MIFTGFDVETWGDLPEYALQPYRARAGQAYITSVAASSWSKLFPEKEELRAWLLDCAAKKLRIVGWNTPFDVAWLIAIGLREEVYANKWADAMLMLKHLEVRPEFATPDGKRQSFSLKEAVRRHLPQYADYEKDVSYDPSVDPAGLLKYNVIDREVTLMLADYCWSRMTPNMRRIHLTEAASIPMVAETYVEGMHIDEAASAELDQQLEADANVAFVTLKMMNTEVTPEKLSSPKQLGELFYKEWGLMIPKTTDKGAASTDKEALYVLSHQDERAKLVKDYRNATGWRAKFAAGTLTSVEYNGDGRVRPQHRIYSTYTGRMTISSKQGKGKDERPTGVALHQWKRDPLFRKQIKAPPGYTLLEFDFAGQEFRWMAVMSDDHTMLQLCQPGEDAHAFMGAKVAQWPYSKIRRLLDDGDSQAKKFRQTGKVGNLSLQYRTSAPRLQRVAQIQYDIPMTEDEARVLHASYRTTYAGVPKYWRRQAMHAAINGYVENAIGRRVYLGTGDTWPKEKKWFYESTAINFPIQSIGAEQKYLALLMLRDLLPEYDGRFYFELHDGLFVVVPNDKALAAAHKIKHVLSNLPYKKLWNVSLPVAFPVDAKLGTSWGNLTELRGD